MDIFKNLGGKGEIFKKINKSIISSRMRMYKNVLKISYLKINLCGHNPRAATTFRDPPNKNIEKALEEFCYLCGFVIFAMVMFQGVACISFECFVCFIYFVLA